MEFFILMSFIKFFAQTCIESIICFTFYILRVQWGFLASIPLSSDFQEHSMLCRFRDNMKQFTSEIIIIVGKRNCSIRMKNSSKSLCTSCAKSAEKKKERERKVKFISWGKVLYSHIHLQIKLPCLGIQLVQIKENSIFFSRNWVINRGRDVKNKMFFFCVCARA